MAEQSSRRDSNTRLRPGGQQQPPQPPGWRVTPAPDGRGRPPDKRPSGPNPRWLALFFIVALLALNFWVSSQVLGPNPRVRIPYSPTFLTQVNENNVSSVSSTGSSIEGTLKSGYQTTWGGATPTVTTPMRELVIASPLDHPDSTATGVITALLRSETGACREEGLWDIKLA